MDLPLVNPPKEQHNPKALQQEKNPKHLLSSTLTEKAEKVETTVAPSKQPPKPTDSKPSQPRRTLRLQENSGKDPSLETDPKLQRQDIFNLVQQIETGDPKIQAEAISKLRKYLSIRKDPPIQDVVDCEAPRRIVSLLQTTKGPYLQVNFSCFFLILE